MIVRNGFEVLVERVQALKVFQRNKKPVRLKVLSTLLYYAGLSYRVAVGFASVEPPASLLGGETEAAMEEDSTGQARREAPRTRPRILTSLLPSFSPSTSC